MKSLALYNIKGGVGKTTAAVNLAWVAAESGYRTLLWDLDPQAAATFFFRIRPRVKGGGKALLERKRRLARAVRGTDFPGLDVVPGDFSYRNLDLHLEAVKRPTKRLGRLLRSVAGDYDLVLFDCAPSISLVSEAVFAASDALLVPTIPTTLSMRTLDRLLEHLRDEGPAVPVYPFFSMVDRRKSLQRDIVAAGHAAESPFLRTAIPYSAVVERMGVERAPVGVYEPRTPAAGAFAELWGEVEAILFPCPSQG